MHLAQASKSKKPPNNLLRTQYTITNNGDGTISYCCNNCTDYIKKNVKQFNATRALGHSLDCRGTDDEVKEQLEQSTQRAKKTKSSAILAMSSSSMSQIREIGAPSPASVSFSNISYATPNHQKNNNNKKKQASINSSVGGLGPGMEKASAHKAIKAEVRAMLARNEPMSRLLDDYVKAAIIQRCPGIDKFYPSDERTIIDTYVREIDRECHEELQNYIAKLPGNINIAMDGATINGKQKVSLLYSTILWLVLNNILRLVLNNMHSLLIFHSTIFIQILYTLSRSDFSVFLDMSSLGTLVHVTEAEVADALRVCERAKKMYKSTIASIPVDNAARHVAARVCEELEESALVSRDPSHTVDLMSKDMATLPFVKRLMAEVKEVYDFVKIDRIDSMRARANVRHELDEYCAVADNRVETRMNSLHDYTRGVRNQAQFLAYLPTCEDYGQYYCERNQREKDRIDGILERCNHHRWERMDFFTNTLTVHFKRLHKLVNMEEVPLSAYLLLCQAMRNELNKAMNADPEKFDQLLGRDQRHS